jgi:hypothetical protein
VVRAPNDSFRSGRGDASSPHIPDLELSGRREIAQAILERNNRRRRKNMTTAPALDWEQILSELGPAFARRAAAYDGSDGFVAENYAEMPRRGCVLHWYPKNSAAAAFRIARSAT